MGGSFALGGGSQESVPNTWQEISLPLGSIHVLRDGPDVDFLGQLRVDLQARRKLSDVTRETS